MKPVVHAVDVNVGKPAAQYQPTLQIPIGKPGKKNTASAKVQNEGVGCGGSGDTPKAALESLQKGMAMRTNCDSIRTAVCVSSETGKLYHYSDIMTEEAADSKAASDVPPSAH